MFTTMALSMAGVDVARLLGLAGRRFRQQLSGSKVPPRIPLTDDQRNALVGYDELARRGLSGGL